jgi:hypothetical protein
MGALTPANWTSEFVAKMTFVITQELPYPNARTHFTLGYADNSALSSSGGLLPYWRRV